MQSDGIQRKENNEYLTANQNLTRDDILTHLDALAGILENCVNGGASVSFMLPFSLDKARSFWRGIAESVGRNERSCWPVSTRRTASSERCS
jgi:hypothetical protein